MSAEKMAILKMLDEGKITADTAEKLLSALGDTAREGSGAEAGAARGGSQGNQQYTDPGAAQAKNWASDLGKKIEVVAKDLEPRIQKIAGAVVDKTVVLADMATKSFHNSREAHKERAAEARAAERTPAPSPSPAPTAPASTGGGAMELVVDSGAPNEIVLKSPRGSVNVKGYNGDKATIKATCKKRSSAAPIEFLKLGCVFQLNYNVDEYEEINLEAYIPYSMFRQVYVETSAGDVVIDNLNCQKVLVNTSKCHVALKNIIADSVKVDNLDGQVLLSNSSGESLVAENANGGIDATNTDFATLKLETTAEPVNLISQGFYKFYNYKWTVRTSNARLKAILPVSTDTGYDIKAYTSLSDISNGLSGLRYTRNDRNCIEGTSENLSSCAKKVKIELDTSNAPLYLN